MDVISPAPDDALAQPTRAAIFALLGDLKRPARTEELAEHLGLHVNGVRVHLDRLAGDGLVTRTRVRQAVGRPYDAWSISPDARPHGEAPHAYLDLGRWLSRAIPPTKKRLREVEAAGREIGHELATPGGPGTVPDRIEATLATMGFQPRRRKTRDGTIKFCLDNCPYRDAIRDDQQVVCTLHRGMTRGILDALQPGARVVAFEPKNPARAGCLVEIDLGDDEQ